MFVVKIKSKWWKSFLTPAFLTYSLPPLILSITLLVVNTHPNTQNPNARALSIINLVCGSTMSNILLKNKDGDFLKPCRLKDTNEVLLHVKFPCSLTFIRFRMIPQNI